MHLSHVVGFRKAVLGLELVVKWVSGWRWVGKVEERYLVVCQRVLAHIVNPRNHIYVVFIVIPPQLHPSILSVIPSLLCNIPVMTFTPLIC